MSKGNQNFANLDLGLIEKQLQITEEDKKQKVILKKVGEVFYLILNAKINTFNKQFLREINDKLDEVEQNEGPTALVTIGLSQKFYSTGMDLKYISSLEGKDVYFFVLELIHLYGRLLAFSVPTVAVLNGHAFAGGCMLAFSHDYILMRNDFGNLCMTEIELGMPLPPGMMAVVKNRTGNTKEFRQLIFQAKRFNAKEAFAAGWIDSASDPKTLLQEGMDLANKVAKFGQNKANYKKLKEEQNKDAIDACFNKQHAVGVRGETNVSIGAKL